MATKVDQKGVSNMRTSRARCINLASSWILIILVTVGCLLILPKRVLAFSDSEARQALEAAMEYVTLEYHIGGELRQGVAYRFGGQDTISSYTGKIAQGAEPGKEAGIDASGLVVNAYRSVYPGLRFVQVGDLGEMIVNDASSMTLYMWNVRPLAPEELKPGDLVFFGTEGSGINGVALYADQQDHLMQIVTASQSQGKVVVTRVRVGGDYWNRSFAGAGRLIKR